jgi:hypothetical protein
MTSRLVLGKLELAELRRTGRKLAYPELKLTSVRQFMKGRCSRYRAKLGGDADTWKLLAVPKFRSTIKVMPIPVLLLKVV